MPKQFVYGCALYDPETGETGAFTPYHLMNMNHARMSMRSQIELQFLTLAPIEEWTWRTPKEIAGIAGYGHIEGRKILHEASRAMRSINGNQRKRGNGKNLILCPPLRCEKKEPEKEQPNAY